MYAPDTSPGRAGQAGWARRVAGVLAAASLLGLATPAQAQGRLGLGQPLGARELAGWDIDVRADGAGLPAGKGDAQTGARLYAEQCAACHGAKGEGRPAVGLAVGAGSLATARPLKSVGSFWPYATTVFDYIRRAMPHQAPQSLKTDEVYAVTAYVLHLNGIVGPGDEMNATTLPRVKMPNREGFRQVID